MKPAWSLHSISVCLLAASAGSVSPAAFGDTPSGGKPVFKVSKGLTPPNTGKAAEVFHIEEEDDRSTSTHVAARGSGFLTHQWEIVPAISEFTFGASIAKDTGGPKPQDVRTVQATYDVLWGESQQVEPGKPMVFTSLALNGDDNRKSGAKGHTVQLTAFGNNLCRERDTEVGDWGFLLTCQAYAGVYRRKVNATDDAAATPVGSYGGPYAGFLLSIGLATVKPDFKVWSPLSLEIAGYKVRDTHASAAYSTATYDFATISLKYRLYEGADKKFKPALVLSRAIGTDRLANETYVARTRLGVEFSYGLP